jgi:hypothetical protein
MSFVSDYTFDNISRIGNDKCCVEQNTIQSAHYNNYMLQNFFASDCSMKKPIDLATSQPCINYKGGFNVGAGGCNINDSSNLQIGSIQTHPRCRIDLFHRPFATIPYLGRGAVCPVSEAQIQQGETIVNKKSVTRLGEASYINYHQTPLLSDISERINNPANFIESSASAGWIRGGLPSREMTRDASFYDSKGKNQNV